MEWRTKEICLAIEEWEWYKGKRRMNERTNDAITIYGLKNDLCMCVSVCVYAMVFDG